MCVSVSIGHGYMSDTRHTFDHKCMCYGGNYIKLCHFLKIITGVSVSVSVLDKVLINQLNYNSLTISTQKSNQHYSNNNNQ